MLKMSVAGKHKGQAFSAWKIETRGTLHRDKNTPFYAGDSEILPQHAYFYSLHVYSPIRFLENQCIFMNKHFFFPFLFFFWGLAKVQKYGDILSCFLQRVPAGSKAQSCPLCFLQLHQQGLNWIHWLQNL